MFESNAWNWVMAIAGFNIIFVVMWWRMKSVTDPIERREEEMDMVG